MNAILRVKEKRLEKGWTQEELSARSFVSQATISSLETGHRSPVLLTLCAIATALDCSLSDLIEIEEGSR